jgi:hypothetical protein
MDLFTKGIHKPLHNIISGITAEREWSWSLSYT